MVSERSVQELAFRVKKNDYIGQDGPMSRRRRYIGNSATVAKGRKCDAISPFATIFFYIVARVRRRYLPSKRSTKDLSCTQRCFLA